jgi:hypothetical protein
MAMIAGVPGLYGKCGAKNVVRLFFALLINHRFLPLPLWQSIVLHGITVSTNIEAWDMNTRRISQGQQQRGTGCQQNVITGCHVVDRFFDFKTILQFWNNLDASVAATGAVIELLIEKFTLLIHIPSST